MNEIPLVSSSMDYVKACQALHHNDGDGLRRTFQEAYRILMPRGTMLVGNETLKAARDPVGGTVDGVSELEGYEHAHWAARCRWEAKRADSPRRVEPVYHPWFDRLEPRRISKRDWRAQLERRARHRPARPPGSPRLGQPRRRRRPARDGRQ